MSSTNTSNTANKEIIQQSILKIQTLRAEYDATLAKYKEAMDNHINTTSATSNPCINYSLDSKNISQLCYDKVWHDQGCISNVPSVKNSDTLDDIVKYIYDLSKSNDVEKKKVCYGTQSVNISNDKKIVYPNEKDYIQIKQKTWWGTSEDKTETVNNADECIALCESSAGCSGATFNPDKKLCWTRKGNSSLSDGMVNDYAILKNSKYELIILKNLNEEMLELSRKIMDEINKIKPYVNNFEEETQLNSQTINNYYDTLLIHETNINDELQDYYDIQQQYTDSNLFITQQHYLYNIYAVLSLIIIAVTAKKIYESENNLFMILLIGIIWGMYLLFIKIRKMK